MAGVNQGIGDKESQEEMEPTGRAAITKSQLEQKNTFAAQSGTIGRGLIQREIEGVKREMQI